MSSPWATPKYGSDFNYPVGLKDGDNIFRIIPPLFSQELTGKWALSHAQHFGYPTKSGDKSIPNNFYCVEKSKFVSGELVVLQACPEDVLIKEHLEEWDTAKKTLTKQGKSETEIKVATDSLASFCRTHNRDFKWYLNVKWADGTFGCVKIAGKAKKAIDKRIAELQKRKVPIDPISADQGVWFRVTRTGKYLNTEYDAFIVTEEVAVNGQTYERIKAAPLSEADYAMAQEKCRDLTEVGIRRLTLEQVQLLVGSGGDPDVVDAVFKTGEKIDTKTAPAATNAYVAPTSTENITEITAQIITTVPSVSKTAPAPASTPAPAAATLPTAKSAAQKQYEEAQNLLKEAQAAMQAEAASFAVAVLPTPVVIEETPRVPVAVVTSVVKPTATLTPTEPVTNSAEQDFDSFTAGFATEGQ